MWHFSLLVRSGPGWVSCFRVARLTAFLVSVLRGWYLVLPASRWQVRVERGPMPHLLIGKQAVSSPTALPWDTALTLHRRLLSRQNGHTRDTTVLLSPHLSFYQYSILLFRETFVSLCGDPWLGSGSHQAQEVRAVGGESRGGSSWVAPFCLQHPLLTASPLNGYMGWGELPGVGAAFVSPKHDLSLHTYSLS